MAGLAQVVGGEWLQAAARGQDQARDDLPLTYFEFGTLAALLIFSAAGLDALILEVGLGGRLDAVNLVDPDVALFTSIGLDHQDWLGEDLEAIGAEKAAIMRPGRPAVFSGRAQNIGGKAAKLLRSLWTPDQPIEHAIKLLEVLVEEGCGRRADHGQ